MKTITVSVTNGKIGHKLKKLKEYDFYLCLTCNEIVKSDGHLLEGNEFHGVE